MFDDAWRYVDAFRVRQAAALWSNHEPVPHRYDSYPDTVRGKIDAATQMLCGAVVIGDLKVNQSTNRVGDVRESTVTRDELIRYARAKGLFPAFLFDTIAPDDDPEPEDQAPKKKRGRPYEHDWDLMYAYIVRKADLDGLPEVQARLVEDVLEWFSIDPVDDNKERKPPADRLVQERISKLYKIRPTPLKSHKIQTLNEWDLVPD